MDRYLMRGGETQCQWSLSMGLGSHEKREDDLAVITIGSRYLPVALRERNLGRFACKRQADSRSRDRDRARGQPHLSLSGRRQA
jgi:hypothetical protein